MDSDVVRLLSVAAFCAVVGLAGAAAEWASRRRRLRRVSAMVIYGEDGRFLLQHRTDDAPRWPGCWGLFGGVAEDGETPREAMARELLEELCLVLPDMEVVGHRDFPEAGLSVTCFASLTRSSEEELLRDLREGQSLRFFRPEETESLPMTPDAPHFIGEVARLLSRRRGRS